MKSTKLSLGSILQLCGFAALLPVTGTAMAQDAMFVESTGDVGVGTNNPAAPLHVERAQGAAVRVENTSAATGAAANDVMFRLVNASSDITRFVIRNATSTWTFDNAGDSFRIVLEGGSLAPEFTVNSSGTARFRGDVFARGVKLSSSRTLKTDFAPVHDAALLEKVAALDISRWRYKSEPETAQHIGPVAEQFHTVFGLGDNKHISAVDAIGIAFSAIQALQSENKKLRDRLQKLEAVLAK